MYMKYSKIYDPISKKFIELNSDKGSNILRNYLEYSSYSVGGSISIPYSVLYPVIKGINSKGISQNKFPNTHRKWLCSDARQSNDQINMFYQSKFNDKRLGTNNIPKCSRSLSKPSVDTNKDFAFETKVHNCSLDNCTGNKEYYNQVESCGWNKKNSITSNDSGWIRPKTIEELNDRFKSLRYINSCINERTRSLKYNKNIKSLEWITKYEYKLDELITKRVKFEKSLRNYIDTQYKPIAFPEDLSIIIPYGGKINDFKTWKYMFPLIDSCNDSTLFKKIKNFNHDFKRIVWNTFKTLDNNRYIYRKLIRQIKIMAEKKTNIKIIKLLDISLNDQSNISLIPDYNQIPRKYINNDFIMELLWFNFVKQGIYLNNAYKLLDNNICLPKVHRYLRNITNKAKKAPYGPIYNNNFLKDFLGNLDNNVDYLRCNNNIMSNSKQIYTLDYRDLVFL